MDFLGIWTAIKARALEAIGRATYAWFKAQGDIPEEDMQLILDGFIAGLNDDQAAP